MFIFVNAQIMKNNPVTGHTAVDKDFLQKSSWILNESASIFGRPEQIRQSEQN